jgi:hypothetical protein
MCMDAIQNYVVSQYGCVLDALEAFVEPSMQSVSAESKSRANDLYNAT